MTFAGFDPAAIALLAELPDWSPETYAIERDRLALGITGPGLDLITEVATRLDGGLTVKPRSSVSPLHRDLRFAPPGSPRFKDHLLLTAWAGVDKKTSATLWIRVDAARVGFASGMGLDPPARDRWRAAVAGPAGAELAAVLDRLVVERKAEVAGEQLRRVPAGYPADHPREGLLRQAGFQVRVITPLPAEVASPAFVDWCSQRLEELLPVHRWLVAHVQDTRSEGGR